jgi:hypothetical protein
VVDSDVTNSAEITRPVVTRVAPPVFAPEARAPDLKHAQFVPFKVALAAAPLHAAGTAPVSAPAPLLTANLAPAPAPPLVATRAPAPAPPLVATVVPAPVATRASPLVATRAPAPAPPLVATLVPAPAPTRASPPAPPFVATLAPTTTIPTTAPPATHASPPAPPLAAEVFPTPPTELCWTTCGSLFSVDPILGLPIVSAPELSAPELCMGTTHLPQLDVHIDVHMDVQMRGSLLYWNGRRHWMWHKKWCIPDILIRISRDARRPDTSTERLFVIASAGTIVEGRHGLHDVGLGGVCWRRVLGGEALFNRLSFTTTSYKCGNRPFHLVFTLVAESSDQGGAQGDVRGEFMVAVGKGAAGAMAEGAMAEGAMAEGSRLLHLRTAISCAIHVDARKRTHAERPDARADDVRLARRKHSTSSHATCGSPQRSVSLPIAVRYHLDPRPSPTLAYSTPLLGAPPYTTKLSLSAPPAWEHYCSMRPQTQQPLMSTPQPLMSTVISTPASLTSLAPPLTKLLATQPQCRVTPPVEGSRPSAAERAAAQQIIAAMKTTGSPPILAVHTLTDEAVVACSLALFFNAETFVSDREAKDTFGVGPTTDVRGR